MSALGVNAMMVQAVGGLFLFALLALQLAMGLRWIKLGKSHFKIHRWVGIGIVVIAIPHLLNGLALAGWLKI